MRKPITNASFAMPAPNSRAIAISLANPVRRLRSTAADTTPAERTTFSCGAESGVTSGGCTFFRLDNSHLDELVHVLSLSQGREADARQLRRSRTRSHAPAY